LTGKHAQFEAVEQMLKHKSSVNVLSKNKPYSPFDEKFQTADIIKENMK
jgi:hypothetical protein